MLYHLLHEQQKSISVSSMVDLVERCHVKPPSSPCSTSRLPLKNRPKHSKDVRWDTKFTATIAFKSARAAPWLEVFWTLGWYCWWFRNPVNSPGEVGSLSHYLQGLIHLRWCRISCLNSMKWTTEMDMMGYYSQKAEQLKQHTLDSARDTLKKYIIRGRSKGNYFYRKQTLQEKASCPKIH